MLRVTDRGTFEHGSSTLQLRGDPDDAARLADVRRRAHRGAGDQRVRPARDDKVVAAWNGLAIAGLCDAGLLLGEPEYVDAAVAAGLLLVDLHLRDGRLLRVSRDGSRWAAMPACWRTTVRSRAGSCHWRRPPATPAGWTTRSRCSRRRSTHFRADDGGFHDTADDAEPLVARPRDPSDNASPSGLSLMVHALSTYAALTGSGRHRDAAEEALATVAELARRAPRFAGWSLAAAQTMLDGPDEIAVVGPPGPERDALAARRAAAPWCCGRGRRRPARGPPAAGGPHHGRRPPGGVRLPPSGLRPSGHLARRAAPRGLRPKALRGLP